MIQENLLEQSIHHRSSKEQATSLRGHSMISDRTSLKGRKPLICIEIDTGEDSREKIEVFKGDDPQLLAARFCELHQYDEITMQTLQR